MAVRIVIFEDNTRLRQSLTTLLNGIEDYFVCGDYENCLNAAAIVDELHPDVVIMDIDMPGVDGIDGLRIIKERRPQTYIIMHTVFEDEDRLFQSLCAGANGYILKNVRDKPTPNRHKNVKKTSDKRQMSSRILLHVVQACYIPFGGDVICYCLVAHPDHLICRGS